MSITSKISKIDHITYEIRGASTTTPILWIYGLRDDDPRDAEIIASTPGLTWSRKKQAHWMQLTPAEAAQESAAAEKPAPKAEKPAAKAAEKPAPKAEKPAAKAAEKPAPKAETMTSSAIRDAVQAAIRDAVQAAIPEITAGIVSGLRAAAPAPESPDDKEARAARMGARIASDLSGAISAPIVQAVQSAIRDALAAPAAAPEAKNPRGKRA